MGSEVEELTRMLADQQRQIDELTREVEQFRTLALAAYKDVGPVRAGTKVVAKAVRPIMPAFRIVRNFITGGVGRKDASKPSGAALKTVEDLKKK